MLYFLTKPYSKIKTAGVVVIMIPVENGKIATSTQGEISNNVELSKEDLTSRAYRVLTMYAEKAIYPLYDKVRKGEGRQVLSSDEEGRPGEELLDIDQTAENVLKSAIREVKLPAVLISENSPEPQYFGSEGSEKLFLFADPFDNTSQYKRNLDTPPYTVASIWDKEGNPIGAVIGDIKDRKAYLSLGRETFTIDIKEKIDDAEKHSVRKGKLLEEQEKLLKKSLQLLTRYDDDKMPFGEKIKLITNNYDEEKNTFKADLLNNNARITENENEIKELEMNFAEDRKKEYERKKIHRSERTTLLDKSSTLATFAGEKEYSLEFFKLFGKLIGDMHPKGLLYTGGGAYIYGLLANGSVDAYVITGEPYSEIIPGLPILLASGGGAVSVKENGTYEEIKVTPMEYLKDHKLYAEGSVPLFIAYSTPQVRDELIKYYKESVKEHKNQEEVSDKPLNN